MTSMNSFRELEFDLPAALLAELTKLFEEMAAAPLSIENASSIPDGQGVYQLFHENQLVYIGKTDAEAGLGKRLLRHARKIRSRLNLDAAKVSFKAIRVYVFAAMDLESALISHYKRTRGLTWNHSGFGANDPGRKRDHPEVKDNHFDASYPIDLSLQVIIDDDRGTSAASLLTQLKEQLPYTIRFETVAPRSKKAHRDLFDANLSISPGHFTAHSILRLVANALGSEWQITAFPGYVIVYKESQNYAHGRVIR